MVSSFPARGHTANEGSGGGGLGEQNPRHDRRATAPAERPKAVAGEREAEERREDRLHRERERGARRRRPALRPRLHEEPERACEKARDEERAPDRSAVRDAEIAVSARGDEQTAGRRGHLDKRERERVITRCETLQENDLQRVDRRR